jgi:hypothetical protein
MDKTELLISVIDKASELYDILTDSDLLDPVETEGALELLQQFREELEILVD